MSKTTVPQALSDKANNIFVILRKLYPEAKIALNFSSPEELLVATILSAQCTDKKVNEVTASLFRKYCSPRDYAQAALGELEKDIKQTGFFRQKAKSVKATMTAIVKLHHGQVPRSMEELVSLPGVGRKTANVVLGNAFGIPGLPVDTHVTRVSVRLGLTKNKTAEKIEMDLNAIVPQKHWTMFSHLLIFHGRNICRAKKPLCANCPLLTLCDNREVLD